MTSERDDDLFARLSTLGDHFDTERAGFESPANPAQHAPRRSSRGVLIVAASTALIAGGLFGLTRLDQESGVRLPTDGAASLSAAPDQTSHRSSDEVVPSIPSASLPNPGDDAPCSAGGRSAVVPLVVGMSYDEAARALTKIGFDVEASFENSPAGSATGNDPVVNQLATGSPVPGGPAPCGALIRLAVALLPGALHVVQTGETYTAIAESEGVDVDDLLTYNGLTREEIASQGRSINSPLMAGEALQLEWQVTAIDGPVCSQRPEALTRSQRAALLAFLDRTPGRDVVDDVAADWCGGQLTPAQVRALVDSLAADE